MSAPFPTSSLANSLNLRVSTPAARNAVLGIDGIGASSDSFSRTLQNQMNAGANAGANTSTGNPSAPSRTPESPREPERSRERSAADKGARDAHTERADKGNSTQNTNAPHRSDKPATGDKNDGATGKDADASAETQVVTDESAAAAATAVAHASTQAQVAAVDDALASATTAAAATPATDAAALAGLPAALAALLSGRQTPQSGDAGAELATDAPLLATGGKGRSPDDSLQNSGLLPKTDVSAEAGGRGVSTPAFLVQGRELAAAMISAGGRAAGQAMQSLQGEPGSAGTQPGVQGLHTHGAMHLLRHAPATQAATPQLPVHTPAGQQAWAEDVGNQVRWMLGRAESKADLVLTPPNLGKLEVSINLNGDQTTAQFIASSQAARDALERAMPQLREVLQQAGIMLADANVSTSQHGASGEGQDGHERTGARGEATIAGEAGGSASGTGVWLRQQQGMVDTFA